MSFAKNILEKWGWKEGQGLGKNESGITIPLKANFKFDQGGLGHNKADELNNHWWERVYNKAANNLDINKNDEHVTVQLKNGKSIEISTKEELTASTSDANSQVYDGLFRKTATLTNAGVEVSHKKDENSVVETATPAKKPISDEELFLACNGRTAHKGARHGLNLSGKLSRIEMQEKELMAKFNQTTGCETPPGKVFNDWIQVKHRASRKPLLSETTPEEEKDVPLTDYTSQDDYVYRSKKQRKKQRQLDASLAAALDASLSTVNPELKIKNAETPKTTKIERTIKKKKRKKKMKKSIEIAIADELLGPPFVKEKIEKLVAPVKKLKKSKKEKLNISMDSYRNIKFDVSDIDEPETPKSIGICSPEFEETNSFEIPTSKGTRKKHRNKIIDLGKHELKMGKRKRSKKKKAEQKVLKRMKRLMN